MEVVTASATSLPVDPAKFAVMLVEKASNLQSLNGVGELVQLFADEFGADGGVLWQIAAGEGDLEERQLIAAAQYFRGEASPFWRQIDMNRWTGQQILAGDSPRLVSPEELKQAVSSPEDVDFQVVEELRIKSFAIIPIYRDGKPWGALNLYGREHGLPESILGPAAHAFAQLIPRLVQDIARRSGLELLTAIRTELRGRAKTEISHASSLSAKLQTIVEMIGDALGVVEASIYLASHAGGEHKLNLVATLWPWPEEHKQVSYKPGEGLTGYCFAEKKPVRIPDLARLQDHDQDRMEAKYPGIAPQIRFDVHEVAKALLPRSRDGRVPPVSWLGAPLIHEQALGIVRVCGLKAGPYYFTGLHESLLLLVADQIAEWISEQNRFENVRSENAWLRRLVKGMAGLNHRVHHGLTSEKFQKPQLLNEALSVASDAIPNAESFSIRLAEGDALRWAATLGRAWESGSRQEIERRKNMTFPLRGPDADNAGAKVFRENKTIYNPDLLRNPYRIAPFPETRSLIIAPVASGNKVFGTMEVRSNRTNGFSEQSVQVTELLGRQIGLYLFLAEKLTEARMAKTKLSDALEQQRETFENLVHQLKTPIFLSVRRTTRLLSTAQKRFPDLAPDIAALRAICRRGAQVVGNIGLFADLAREAAIHVNPVTLVRPSLILQLKETANDHALLLNPADGISFSIDEGSFEPLDQVTVQVDPRLLDQMISNLLENAAKYSFPNSQVLIRGGLTRQQQFFFIAVCNRGVPIAPTEAKVLAERGTRSDRALAKQGSGLGLYLVREMLHAHKGVLEIQPTNANGVTEVRLLLPCLRGGLKG